MKLKRLLTLCCALSMALGMVTFVSAQTIPSKPLLTLSITAARTTRISTTLSIVTAHAIRSITTSLRSNTDSVRNFWKAPSIIPT